MAKRERLHLSAHQNIETYRHGDTRVFIAYSNSCSAMFCDRKELLRFLKVPKSIPMRASLDSWLDSLEAADQERVSKSAEPVGDANVEGSFDPLAHGLDESDPQYQCKTII